MSMITQAAWATTVADAKLGLTLAELHGSATGYVCGGDATSDMLEALALECDAAGGADSLRSLLHEWAEDVAGKFAAGMVVELPLPRGPLTLRAEAMVDWCRGFLGGLGLNGRLGGRAAQALEVRQTLHGLGEIASGNLDCTDDDEPALQEVLAFVRGRVAWLHATLTAGERA